MSSFRKTVAEVDLSALEHNYRWIRDRFPPDTFLCPMVKANAYGHGDAAVALTLESAGARTLGVSLIEEGLGLRRAGVRAEILVFGGFTVDGASELLGAGLTPVVGAWSELEHLERVAKAPVAVHLKFDSGMNRVGFPVKDAEKLFDRIRQSSKLRVKALLSHLIRGEDARQSDGITARQLAQMLEVWKRFRALNAGLGFHALNSAGILSAVHAPAGKESLLRSENWGLRPGLLIYGASPLGKDAPAPLRPVMTFKSVASVLREVRVGETVSYNATWTAPRDSVVAVVPVGYADGYHRSLSNRAQALFNGQRVPQVGNVCMDFIMLDVTEAVRARPIKAGVEAEAEAEVVLFGASSSGEILPAEELASQAGTITWEIMTSVSDRVPRLVRGGALSADRLKEAAP